MDAYIFLTRGALLGGSIFDMAGPLAVMPSGDFVPLASIARTISCTEAVVIVRGACESLARMHEAGIYHTKLSTQTILVSRPSVGGARPPIQVRFADVMLTATIDQLLKGHGPYLMDDEHERRPAIEPVETLYIRLRLDDPHEAAVQVYTDMVGCTERARRVALPFAMYDCACLGIALVHLLCSLAPGGDPTALRVVEGIAAGFIYPYDLATAMQCVMEGADYEDEFAYTTRERGCYRAHLDNMAERLNASHACAMLRRPPHRALTPHDHFT
jgi:hypothetical protein